MGLNELEKEINRINDETDKLVASIKDLKEEQRQMLIDAKDINRRLDAL